MALTVSERQRRFRENQKARIAELEAQLAEARGPLGRLSAAFGPEISFEESEVFGMQCAFGVDIDAAHPLDTTLVPAVAVLIANVMHRGMSGLCAGWRRHEVDGRLSIEVLRYPEAREKAA